MLVTEQDSCEYDEYKVIPAHMDYKVNFEKAGVYYLCADVTWMAFRKS